MPFLLLKDILYSFALLCRIDNYLALAPTHLAQTAYPQVSQTHTPLSRNTLAMVSSQPLLPLQQSGDLCSDLLASGYTQPQAVVPVSMPLSVECNAITAVCQIAGRVHRRGLCQ